MHTRHTVIKVMSTYLIQPASSDEHCYISGYGAITIVSGKSQKQVKDSNKESQCKYSSLNSRSSYITYIFS